MEEQNKKFIENCKCIEKFFYYKESKVFKISYFLDDRSSVDDNIYLLDKKGLLHKVNIIDIKKDYSQCSINISYNKAGYISIKIFNKQPIASSSLGMIQSQFKDISNMTMNEFKSYIEYLYNFIKQYIDIFEWK